MGRFRRRRPQPLPTFDRSTATYPFAFPVILVRADQTVEAHRTPDTFGLCGEHTIWSKDLPSFQVFAPCGRAWKPSELLAAVTSGKRLFGTDLMFAQFAYDEPRSYDLGELRTMVVDSISNDPDDLWSQRASHDAVLAAVGAAMTFEELVDAIIELGGQGR